TIITTLQDSSQNQVGVAKTELQATEKMVEKNMGKELNVLRTYMDKEYPEKVSEYQSGLQQMARNNQELRRQIEMQKKIIDDLGKEIEVLRKHTAALREYVRHPRDLIFEDVLLQRPICTPDMEIVLNIPTEEDLPL
ncbi:PREDICTED: uncharacterized protein C20orf96 homolog, partial [Gekko japonicus]|uniref:Uncharacterized protein C20orf96 homolog n=1 Tax=Gekko japonicus TaxID=146911 RepID=A0ABM1JPQ9_GEKJA